MIGLRAAGVVIALSPLCNVTPVERLPPSGNRPGYRSGTNVLETKMAQKNASACLSCRIDNKTLMCPIIEAAKQLIREQRNGLPGMTLHIDSCRLDNQWTSFQYSFFSR